MSAKSRLPAHLPTPKGMVDALGLDTDLLNKKKRRLSPEPATETHGYAASALSAHDMAMSK